MSSQPSNILSARQSIKAELATAQQGLAYYESRVEALEEALRRLEAIDGALATTTKATKGKQPKAVTGKGEVAKANGKKPAAKNDLPSTGGDFWINLVTDQAQSREQLINAAITALDIKPKKPQVKKLQQRLENAMLTLLKEKKIKDSGSGRDRRFFK